MKMYEIEGYFSNNQVERIKQKLQGKTYMNFNVEYGGIADNNTIIVTSDEAESDEDLKEFVIFYILTLL